MLQVQKTKPGKTDLKLILYITFLTRTTTTKKMTNTDIQDLNIKKEQKKKNREREIRKNTFLKSIRFNKKQV